jgi:hypothetical protein
MNNDPNPEVYRMVREYNLRSDIHPNKQLTQLWQKKEESFINQRLYNNDVYKPSDTKVYLGSGKNMRGGVSSNNSSSTEQLFIGNTTIEQWHHTNMIRLINENPEFVNQFQTVFSLQNQPPGLSNFRAGFLMWLLITGHYMNPNWANFMGQFQSLSVDNALHVNPSVRDQYFTTALHRVVLHNINWNEMMQWRPPTPPPE